VTVTKPVPAAPTPQAPHCEVTPILLKNPFQQLSPSDASVKIVEVANKLVEVAKVLMSLGVI
jgi:hypothetical protein